MRILEWEQWNEHERNRVGDQAEVYVRQIISRHGRGTLFRGPLIPEIEATGVVTGYRESDFLVYTQGNVFCVEVKYYSGRITYLPVFRPRRVWNGSQYIQQDVFSGYDDSKILQVKQGRRGEEIQETYRNPLKKTKSFILQLKRYISRVEPRFQRLYIIPVVCFGEKADISAIADFQNGMIHIEQLPAFFDQHCNPQFMNRPSPWIEQTILNKIPNWDRVQTTSGEWMNGILVEPHLTFLRPDGVAQHLENYASIKAISWQRSSNDAPSQMTVTYTNGTSRSFYCRGGQLSLVRGNQPQVYPIDNLQRLIVGLANKLAIH